MTNANGYPDLFRTAQYERDHHISRLDWALVTLLQRVQRHVLDPITDGWKLFLNTCNPNEISGPQRRLLHNLKCALADPHISSHPLSLNLDWRDRDLRILSESIDRYRTRLFDSYYFIRIDLTCTDYMFFPIGPGLTSLPGSEDDRSASTRYATWFRNYVAFLDLPFQDGRALDSHPSYSGSLLPGIVGVTPQICLHASANGDLRPQSISHFLGDLALLGRSEDAAKRNHAALVAPVLVNSEENGRKRISGALVLTSSVPAAFSFRTLSPGATEISPANRLQQVLDEWSGIHETALHDLARFEARKVLVVPVNENEGASPYAHTVERQTGADWIHRQDGSSPGTAVQVWNGYCAISLNFFLIGLKALYSLTPILAGSKYVSEKSIIEIEKLKELCENINVISIDGDCDILELDVENSRKFMSVCKDFDKIVYPDSVSRDIILLTATIDGHKLVAICRGLNENLRVIAKERLSDASDILASLIKSSCQRDLLPGERRHIHKDLEAAFHDLINNPEKLSSDFGGYLGPFIDKIHELLGKDEFDTGVDGVMIFEECSIFLPKKDPERLRFFELLSPAAFWVFEQVCQFATMKDFSTKRCDAEPYADRAPLVAPLFDENQPGIHVILSESASNNNQCISAINYLGLPVKQWLPPGSDVTAVGPILRVPGGSDFAADNELRKEVMDTLFEYLQLSLETPSTVPALVRAAPTTPKLKSIQLFRTSPSTESGERQLQFQVQFDDHATHSEIITWHEQKSWRLESAMFHFARIGKRLAGAHPEGEFAWGPLVGLCDEMETDRPVAFKEFREKLHRSAQGAPPSEQDSLGA